MESIVSKNSDVYYSGMYWNDFPQVLEYMCENFTGDKQKWWVQDFKDRFATQSYEHGLFLNCGNGWVERDFIDKNIVNKATAFDYSFDLLREAEREKGVRPIQYFLADVNKIDFAEDQFDLIVNVAALHHVQYINRLCLILCKTLKKDGLFVNFDYIGPHRNQYSLRHWYYLQRVNRSLPEGIQKPSFLRPHLPTMLVNDPTEAIHSELIIETVSRWFEIFERHDTGGGIAYEILTHNTGLGQIPPEELSPHIIHILNLDKVYTQKKQVPPLFSYFIARPKKDTLLNHRLINKYQKYENRREYRASKRRGVYSNRDYFLLLLFSIKNERFQQMVTQFARVISKAIVNPMICLHDMIRY